MNIQSNLNNLLSNLAIISQIADKDRHLKWQEERKKAKSDLKEFKDLKQKEEAERDLLLNSIIDPKIELNEAQMKKRDALYDIIMNDDLLKNYQITDRDSAKTYFKALWRRYDAADKELNANETLTKSYENNKPTEINTTGTPDLNSRIDVIREDINDKNAKKLIDSLPKQNHEINKHLFNYNPNNDKLMEHINNKILSSYFEPEIKEEVINETKPQIKPEPPIRRQIMYKPKPINEVPVEFNVKM